MTQQQLYSELHERLLEEQSRLEQEIEHLQATGVNAATFQEDEQDAYDQHPADEGSELFEQEKNMAVLRTLQVSLDEVNAALQRFEQGTYGVCANCGEPIPEARLRAMPAAAYCIRCQAQMEQAR